MVNTHTVHRISESNSCSVPMQAFGMEVSPGERDSIAGMVVALEAYGDVDLLNDSRSLLLEGEWQLQYSTAQEFRSSPFFWCVRWLAMHFITFVSAVDLKMLWTSS